MIYLPSQINEFCIKLIRGRPIIGIDYGARYLGIAKTDNSWLIANPLSVVNATKLNELASVVKDYNCCAIVMGYPLQMDGSEGENCKKVQQFAKVILDKLQLPIYLQDERFTTRIAKNFLNESNLKRKEKDYLDNKIAASVILESFLNFAKIN